MKTSRSRRRKFLSITEDEFFERVLLLWGPPTPEYTHYQDRFSRGIANWIKQTVNGRKFLELVTAHGEARTRAPNMYLKYMRWFSREREKLR